MRTSRTAVVRLLPVLVGAVVLAGCGSSSGTNAGAASTPAGGGGASAASTPSDTAASTQAMTGADFCQKIVAEKAALTSNGLPKLLASGTPDGWKKYLSATADMNNTLYDAAPAEIKSAVDQLRQVNVKLTAILSAAGYDPTKIKSADIIAAVDSPAYTKASADFVAYVKTNCTIDLTKP